MIYLLGVTHAQADPFMINEDASIFAKKQDYVYLQAIWCF